MTTTTMMMMMMRMMMMIMMIMMMVMTMMMMMISHVVDLDRVLLQQVITAFITAPFFIMFDLPLTLQSIADFAAVAL